MNGGAEWIVRQGDEEFRVASVADLREAARANRIVAGTYIFHPFRQQWVYAREIEELAPLFAPLNPPQTSVVTSGLTGRERRGDMVCMNCGFVGRPKMTVPGSGCVELALWLLLIVPGIIYSVWRVSSKVPTCPKCRGLNSMIPWDSPRAREILSNRV